MITIIVKYRDYLRMVTLILMMMIVIVMMKRRQRRILSKLIEMHIPVIQTMSISASKIKHIILNTVQYLNKSDEM